MSLFFAVWTYWIQNHFFQHACFYSPCRWTCWMQNHLFSICLFLLVCHFESQHVFEDHFNILVSGHTISTCFLCSCPHFFNMSFLNCNMYFNVIWKRWETLGTLFIPLVPVGPCIYKCQSRCYDKDCQSQRLPNKSRNHVGAASSPRASQAQARHMSFTSRSCTRLLPNGLLGKWWFFFWTHHNV
jgi:hypothetical protein